MFAELCALFGIDKTKTTPYSPQANGKCERFNRTLVSMLRCAGQKRSYDWEPLLPPCCKLIAQLSRRPPALRRTDSSLAVRYACRLTWERHCPNRRAILALLRLSFQTILSGLIESLENLLDIIIAALRCVIMNASC